MNERTPAVLPPAGTPVAPHRVPSRRRLWMLAGVGLALGLLGVWLVSARLDDLLSTPPEGSRQPADSGSTTTDVRRIQAALFYVSDDGTALMPVSQDVTYGETPSEQARRIVEAQVQAPPEGRQSAIPAGTTVRSVFLTPTGEAYVDLGGAIVSGHPGGSLDEALTVYAIVNALAANLPGVSAVQILIDGQEVDSLVGHLDLRHPLGRALDWVRKGP